VLAVLAVICWSAYAINGRRHGGAPITSTALQAVIAAVLLAPVGLATSTLTLDHSPGAVWSLLYIAVFPSIFSLVLWNFAVGRVGPVRAGVFLNLLPLFTAALGVALGSSLAPGQVIGGLAVIAGVLITSRAKPAARAASPDPDPNPDPDADPDANPDAPTTRPIPATGDHRDQHPR
jgi:drug/metabolite transporter (DMT)-like permease